MEEDQVTICGCIEEITYQNEETGFVVLELDVDGELLCVTGQIGQVSEGENLKVVGDYITHPTYGRQFKAVYCEKSLPKTAQGIIKFLSSGIIKGIGAGTALSIVTQFNDDTFEVIEKNPLLLAKVRGISEKKALNISEQWKQIHGMRLAIARLSSFNIPPVISVKLWNNYRENCEELIGSNPYILTHQNYGMAFEVVDEIARNIGIENNSACRIKAGNLYVLNHNYYNGHTCLPESALKKTALCLLQVNENDYDDVTFSQISDGEVIALKIENKNYIYTKECYDAETYVAMRIALIGSLDEKNPTNVVIDSKIKELEDENKIKYDNLQKEAIEIALKYRLMVLTGGPGTGKTTTLNAIIKLLARENKRVFLCAPTGRAAKRMSELTGYNATTIHRLLEVDFKDNSPNSFVHSEKNPLNCDCVIIDEMSMIDIFLFKNLMSAIKLDTKVIFVGDTNQLPAIGAGHVLKDLILSNCINVVSLDKIFRQAQDSLIIMNAHKIINDETPDLKTKDSDFFFSEQNNSENISDSVISLISKRIPKKYDINPLNVQILCPTRIGVLGTYELNKKVQNEINPKSSSKKEIKTLNYIFREGDKVIQTKNNYDIYFKKDGQEGQGIFNGDIGIIESIDRTNEVVFINFDDKTAQYPFDLLKELELAYAITVHKSQGSEFDAVIIPLMRWHDKLYYRSLLYTAITRAKKVLIILGQSQTLYKMAANNKKAIRYTNLRYLLVKQRESLKQHG